jgi:hypothetical protein
MAKATAFLPATPTEKALQRRDTRRPLQEHATVEGNLMEYPIFALSNKEAKPTKADPSGALDPKTNKVKRVPDYERFKRAIALETKTESGIVLRRVEIQASPEHGYPTILGLEMIIYACHKAQQLGYTSRYVPFTYYDFAKATHRSTGGSSIANMREQLQAILRTTVTFHDAWCRHPTPDEVQAAAKARDAGLAVALPKPMFIGEMPEMRMLDGARILARNDTPKDILEVLYGDESDEPETRPSSYLRLSDEVFHSLRAGYKIGIDPEYLFGLRLPVSKRMYVLLTKRDDRKHDWEQDLFRFCARVGLKRTRGPADAMDQLQPGIDELKTPTKEGKLFLQDGGLVDVRGERPKIRFVFARADPARAETISEEMHKYLRARLRTDLYENFFAAIRFSLDNRGVEHVLVLEVQDQFKQDFLYDNYKEFLEGAAETVLGRPTKLAFIVGAGA